MKRLAHSVLIGLLAIAFIASPALADKVVLKDGRVIEGTITREGDDFLYISYTIGELERTEFIMRIDIERIERDEADEETEETPDRPRRSPETRSESRPARPASLDDLPPGTFKIAFITLEEMVGPFMNASALKRSVELLEDDDPDIVVLQIKSGGGAAVEVQKLSDAIQFDIKPKYRVVAWIDSAISAAAMTAWTCEEIYMMKSGHIGAATAFIPPQSPGGRAVAAKGEQLERFLRQMEDISKRGRHEPLVMRAMQVETELSCDIDERGNVHWRNDLSGQHIVSTSNKILTLNSVDAVQYKIARGIADTKDELARLLGAQEWVEVGHEADAYQRRFREDVQTAQVRAGELFQKMQIALNAGNISRAKSFLGQLRGWVRRAPSLEEYGAAGLPPLTREFFREVEEQIDRIAERQRR